MEKIKRIIEREKIFITKEALELLEQLVKDEYLASKIDSIIKELKHLNELITKESILEIIKKFSKESSPIIKTKIETEKKEIKEPLSIASGYSGFLMDRFLKLKSVLEYLHNKRANADSLSLSRMNDKSIVTMVGMLNTIKEGKFGSIILELEDQFGLFRAIIPSYKRELIELISNLNEDDVLLIEGTLIKSDKGFYIKASNIYLPDLEYKREDIKREDYYIACISDIRFGNEDFDEDAFINFIKLINGKIDEYKEISKKIKWLLITGDLVEGFSLMSKYKYEVIDDLYSQYEALAALLSKIREDITIYAIPGERDSLIPVIPLQAFDQEIAEPLYKLKNLVLLEDPAFINISGYNVLMTHGYYFESFLTNFLKKNNQEDMTNTDLLRKALIETMNHVLKKRYLLPSIRIKGLLPIGYDPFVITKRPDILVCGHFNIACDHSYKGCLLISNSSWINITEENTHSSYLINLKDLSVRKILF